MCRFASFVPFVLILAVARSLPLDGSNEALDSVVSSRSAKNAEKVSEDVKSAANKTSAEPKSPSSGAYRQSSYMPSVGALSTPNAVPYYPPVAPNYSGFAPATYTPNSVSSYPVTSPYGFPWAVGPQQPVATPYSAYLYRDQEQPRESKITSPTEAKTFHRLLRPDSGYLPSHYLAQPQFYSAPASAYQPVAAAPAVQPFMYASVPEYGSNTPYYNYARSLNTDTSYSIPSAASVQYTSTGRDAVASTRDMLDSSFGSPLWDDGYKRMEDLRQPAAQNSRPLYSYEHPMYPRSAVSSRVATDEPLVYPSSAVEIAPFIPSPTPEDQVYIVMNPLESNQNGQSKAVDYYTSNYPNADAMMSLVTPAQMPAPMKALVPAASSVNAMQPLPSYAHPNFAAQMDGYLNNIYKQNLESEKLRKRFSQDLHRAVMKQLYPEARSNETKEIAKEQMPKEEAKKTDDKSEKKV